MHPRTSSVKVICGSSEQGMSGGLRRKSQVIYLLAPGNKYEDVVSYFLGLKVSIELWNFCKRAVQTPVVLSWEARPVPAGLLSLSMTGLMPGDHLFAWLLVPNTFVNGSDSNIFL
jgi:hypothetical protein